jgi:drug/metabolite transporter (DMT)-like permease
MSDTGQSKLRTLLLFAAIVEVGTGLALLVEPRLVVGLLVGEKTPVGDIPMGRLPGIAILALGLACWPSGRHGEAGSPAFRGMLVYNVLIAVFLVYLFEVGHLGGALLWPAAALHAVVAMLLVWLWLRERREARERGLHASRTHRAG